MRLVEVVELQAAERERGQRRLRIGGEAVDDALERRDRLRRVAGQARHVGEREQIRDAEALRLAPDALRAQRRERLAVPAVAGELAPAGAGARAGPAAGSGCAGSGAGQRGRRRARPAPPAAGFDGRGRRRVQHLQRFARGQPARAVGDALAPHQHHAALDADAQPIRRRARS